MTLSVKHNIYRNKLNLFNYNSNSFMERQIDKTHFFLLWTEKNTCCVQLMQVRRKLTWLAAYVVNLNTIVGAQGLNCFKQALLYIFTENYTDFF